MEPVPNPCRTRVEPGGEYFPYGFKGARSAPDPGRRLVLVRRTRSRASSRRRGSSLARAAVSPGWSCAGRLVPLLGPSGHGGLGTLQTPAPAALLEVATTEAQPRAAHKAAILPAIQH